ALPFWRAGRAEMIVPAVVVRRLPDGTCWLTVTGTDPQCALDGVRRRLEAGGTVPDGTRR
ncbi:MAG: hypothetical protein ACRDY1_06185, partial [Acidimicrobiales bacterium]